MIDDLTGGLELSHTIELSAKDFPGLPGSVREMKWTPDGCAVILSWSKGGISLWSTFGTMLMCSLGWDYGLNVDLATKNPLDIIGMVCSICYISLSNYNNDEDLRSSLSIIKLYCRTGPPKAINYSCYDNEKYSKTSQPQMHPIPIHPIQIAGHVNQFSRIRTPICRTRVLWLASNRTRWRPL